MLSAQTIFKMTTQIDFRTLPANVPVLCIPRVYANISLSRIRKIFDDLGMGTLERIDIVSKTSTKPGGNPLEKGEKFNRVFVHFRRWNDSENANIARERLLNGKEIKIIYDDPWFWKISAYREVATRRELAPQQSSRKATITFDFDEDDSSRPVLHREDRSKERPRRRDDSRERPKKHYDHHKTSNSNRYEHKPDFRRYTTGYPVGHPANDKESREMPVRKFVDCEAPSNHPTSECDEVLPSKIDYGNIIPPEKKRKHNDYGKNKPIEIENKDSEVNDVK